MINENSLVSIIMPVYNVGKFLNRCVDSILCQTYENFELIAVNDGSTDNSLEILKNYQKNDRRIKLINIDNAGVSNARNVGISKASGEWFIFADSDDWLEKNSVEKLLSHAKTEGVDIVIGNHSFDYDDEKLSKFPNFYKDNKNINSIDAVIISYEKSAVVWAKIFSRKSIENLKFSKKYTIGEDGLFLFDAMKNRKISFISDVVYHYYQRGNSVTAVAFNMKMMDGIYSSLRLHDEMINFSEKLVGIADFRVQRAVSVIINKLLNVKNINKKINEINRKSLKGSINIFKKNKYINWKTHIQLSAFLIFGIIIDLK